MIKEPPAAIEINISPERVCYIIVKARELDAKDADDPTFQELKEAIVDLNEDEVLDLIAIAWIGRGDFYRSDFESARDLATERHRPNSAPYPVGIPNLGDCLEEGLAELGYSCDETVFPDESAIGLSVVNKQRLCIARALAA